MYVSAFGGQSCKIDWTDCVDLLHNSDVTTQFAERIYLLKPLFKENGTSDWKFDVLL